MREGGRSRPARAVPVRPRRLRRPPKSEAPKRTSNFEQGNPLMVEGKMDRYGQEDRRDVEEARQDLIFDPPRIQLDRSIPARPGLTGCVPDREGVYLFHDLRGVLYVGRSSSLRQRFLQHLGEGHNTWLNAALNFPVDQVRFSWVLVGPGESEELERELVRAFRPLCNRITFTTSVSAA